MVNGHTIAQHARNEFGIIPIFWIEFLTQTLNGRFIAALILKLKIIAMCPFGCGRFNDFPFRHILRQHNTFFIVLQPGEDFIGITIEQTHKSHPFLFIILETHNIAFQFLRSNLCHFGLLTGLTVISDFLHICTFGMLPFLFIILRNRNHYACATSITINGATFTSATPRLDIKTIDQCLINIVR